MRANTKETLLAQVDIKGENDCWPWLGGLHSHGYGKARMHGHSTRLAHVIVYTICIGPVTPGKIILHSCNNKSCCNWIKHLHEGTYSENSHHAVRTGVWNCPPANGCPRGVFPYRKGWRAAGTLNRKWVLLYQGNNFDDACQARKAWEESLTGKPAPNAAIINSMEQST